MSAYQKTVRQKILLGADFWAYQNSFKFFVGTPATSDNGANGKLLRVREIVCGDRPRKQNSESGFADWGTGH